MDKMVKKLVETATDGGGLARSFLDAGLRSASEVIRGIRVFGSLTASSVEELDFDETHYVLVPLLNGGYAIYTKRVLPAGIGDTNSLEKKRVFHLPDKSGKKLLEQELVKDLAQKEMSESGLPADLATHLETLAARIDAQTAKTTGGILLISGVIAIVNPIVGLGGLAMSFIPSLGAQASKTGAELVGGKLRKWSLSMEGAKQEKKATKEVRRLKPVIYENPLIRSLDAIATNPATEYDPSLDKENWPDSFSSAYIYQLTAEAISETYEKEWQTLDLSAYSTTQIEWIKSFQ